MDKQRTCIGCRSTKRKSELMRIVRMGNAARLDLRGNAAGRGAYVCSRECFETSVANGRLTLALRMNMKAEAYDEIRQQIGSAYAAGAFSDGKE